MKPIHIFGVVIFALIIVSGVIFGARLFLEDEHRGATSDRGKTKTEFVVGMDSWPGYMPLCSDRLQHQLYKSEKIDIRCVSDGGNYAERMEKLASGELDFAVTTVDAHLLTGPQEKFPGAIVMVIDQSKGGDAIVAWPDKVNGINDLGTTDGWKVAFTPDSPSHQLLRSVGNDFGISTLLSDGNWKVEADGAGDALQKFLKREVDVAVVWEPHVTAAVAAGAKVIHSSDATDKVIVDVLLVNRDLVRPSTKEYAQVQSVLREYFSALRDIRDDSNIMLKEARSFVKTYGGQRLSDSELQSMLDGVQWINLRDNGESWFGIGGESPYYGLREAHEFALTIIRSEKGEDFLSLFRAEQVILSDLISTLYKDGGYLGEAGTTETDPLRKAFGGLTETEWNRLRTVASLKSRPVIFRSGTTDLDEGSRRALAEAMEDFKRYPKSRLELRIGYRTGATQDETQVAQDRSQERALAVQNYIIDTFGVDPDRIRVYVPAPQDLRSMIRQRSGESRRAYMARLRQVELVLKATPL